MLETFSPPVTWPRFPLTGIYVVVTSSFRPEFPPLEIVRQIIDGGAAIIQLREKSMNRDELLPLASAFARLCRDRHVLSIINDDPDLAIAAEADGVHLGQEDADRLDLEAVRATMGDRIIGLSTHSIEQFVAAQATGIDYASFGPLYPTHAKNYHLGDQDVPKVLTAARTPVVLIGGITRANLPALLALGCRMPAIIRDVLQAADIRGAVSEFRNLLMKNPGASHEGILRLRCNGKETLTTAATISEEVASRGLKPETVIVEHNGEMAPRESWAARRLRNEDQLELISIMCGG